MVCVGGGGGRGGKGGAIGDGENKEGYVVSPPSLSPSLSLPLSLPLSIFLFYNHSILIFYLSQ